MKSTVTLIRVLYTVFETRSFYLIRNAEEFLTWHDSFNFNLFVVCNLIDCPKIQDTYMSMSDVYLKRIEVKGTNCDI